MNTAYTNGAEQNTETGKRQMANFAEAAKGMGFALGIYGRGRKKRQRVWQRAAEPHHNRS